MYSLIGNIPKLNDTLYLNLKIDSKGEVILTNFKASDYLHKQIPELDSLLQNGVLNLPKLRPAIKRGIPVTTAFILPIIIMN